MIEAPDLLQGGHVDCVEVDAGLGEFAEEGRPEILFAGRRGDVFAELFEADFVQTQSFEGGAVFADDGEEEGGFDVALAEVEFLEMGEGDCGRGGECLERFRGRSWNGCTCWSGEPF